MQQFGMVVFQLLQVIQADVRFKGGILQAKAEFFARAAQPLTNR
jgi:hypothetical protein